MEATECYLLRQMNSIACMVDECHLWPASAHLGIRIRKPKFAATVQFAKYYMLMSLIVSSNLLLSESHVRVQKG